MNVTVASESRPCQGEDKNGDRAVHVVHADFVLLAVIDALGHGPEAAQVSDRAEACLRVAELRLGLLPIVMDLHRLLGGTRGAAAMLCLLSETQISACSVGNVELRSGDLQIPLISSPGVLGVRVARFRVCEAPLNKSARLLLFTDGISSRVKFSEWNHLTPRELCSQTMNQHRKVHDDSTILVADVNLKDSRSFPREIRT